MRTPNQQVIKMTWRQAQTSTFAWQNFFYNNFLGNKTYQFKSKDHHTREFVVHSKFAIKDQPDQEGGSKET